MHELTLIPGEKNEFTVVVRPSQINNLQGVAGQGGAGFELLIPSLSAGTFTFEEEEESPDVEYDVYEHWGPDIKLIEDVENENTNNPGSSSGGCDVGFGAMIMLGLAGLFIKRR